MGQTLDMLLAADPAKVKDIPTGKIEIKRLSELFGKPFIITFRAGTFEEMKEIGEKATDRNGEYSDTEEMKWTIYELCNDPDFKSKELREKYKVTRPIDIVEKILLGGEIIMVYNAIMKLSGFNKGAELNIDKIKN